MASPLKGPPLERLMDHFLHAIEVAGVDHVGIGADYDGVSQVPEHVDDISTLPVITRELLARGVSEDDVRKVLGLNNLRLFRETLR
jgi:membrane dipeptidase